MAEETEKSDGKVLADGSGTEFNAAALAKLGNHLSQRFSVHKADRRVQEQQWLRNLYQFKGKYDAEIEEKLDPNRSRAYPKLTRTKIMVVVARLMNLLFPQSDKSWTIRPSKNPVLSQEELTAAFRDWRDQNPEGEVTAEDLDTIVKAFANKAAEVMERHIEGQLQDAMGSATETDNSDFVALCRRVILSAAIFNCGVLKGPMTLSRKKARIEITPGIDPTVRMVDSWRPYFDAVDIWRYYPDMQARSFSDMEGEFEDHVYTKQQLEGLAKREDFIPEAIQQFIRENPEGNHTPQNYENDLDNLAGTKQASNRGKRYRLQEFWGNVSRDFIEATGLELPEDSDKVDQFRVTAWVAGRHIVKLGLNPLPPQVNVYHKFVFDDSVPGLMGGSMAEIMRDSQMAVSSAARMLIDNAAVTCGPMLEIDLNKLVEAQDPKTIAPFKSYFVDGKGNPSGHRAINSIAIDSRMNELLSVMNQFLEFADMETFVGGYGGQENTPGEALRTSAGASMVLGNAALPFRDIVRSFDRFTVSVLNALVEWNRLFNDEIEHTGDLRPVAKGATSLIAKEVRAFALDNLMSTITEEERVYIDDQKLLNQKLMARDIPFEDIRATDAVVAKRLEDRQKRQSEAEDQARRMFEAELRGLVTDAMKNAAQAKKNLDNADATAVQTLTKVAEIPTQDMKDAEQLARTVQSETGTAQSQGQSGRAGVG